MNQPNLNKNTLKKTITSNHNILTLRNVKHLHYRQMLNLTFESSCPHTDSATSSSQSHSVFGIHVKTVLILLYGHLGLHSPYKPDLLEPLYCGCRFQSIPDSSL